MTIDGLWVLWNRVSAQGSPNLPNSPGSAVLSGIRLETASKAARRRVMGVVVWVDEIVFIKLKGTRMTRIARIRADLGFQIKSFYLINHH